ncbi:hypothetical protein [Nitrosospira sp. Is2]|nr:hypothetical protein [Nitrosospira sp. Is2]WON75437.1 hypothetical protein R5L00_08220 [Nitrosospira sp. Is2]
MLAGLSLLGWRARRVRKCA